MKNIFWGILIILFLATMVYAKIGGGDITFEEKKFGNVIFSHENHIEGIGLKCTDCHATPYVTKDEHKKVTMAEMKKGQSCGACHNGKKAFDVKDCKSCHKK